MRARPFHRFLKDAMTSAATRAGARDHGPRMCALIGHRDMVRQAGGDPVLARAYVEALVAWIRDSPDCPHGDEGVADDILKSMEIPVRMFVTAARTCKGGDGPR